MGFFKSFFGERGREKAYDAWLKHVYGPPHGAGCQVCSKEWFPQVEIAKTRVASRQTSVTESMGLVAYQVWTKKLAKEGYPESTAGRIAAEHANAVTVGLDLAVGMNPQNLCNTGKVLWEEARTLALRAQGVNV